MKMQFKVRLRFMVLIIVSLTIMSCGIQGMDHRTEYFDANRIERSPSMAFFLFGEPFEEQSVYISKMEMK